MKLWAVWAACLVAVILLALVNVPIWIAAIVMVIYSYHYMRWIIPLIQAEFA